MGKLGVGVSNGFGLFDTTNSKARLMSGNALSKVSDILGQLSCAIQAKISKTIDATTWTDRH